MDTAKASYACSVVDLFSGAGGLSLGAARAGFAVSGAVDIDPEAVNAHGRNFPNAVHLKIDVSNLTGRTLISALGLSNGNLAGIIGGPPCQGFSSIGRKDKDDARNKLFVEFFRIVAETLPTFFLAENVPGIMRESHCETRDRAFSYVEGKYVTLQPMVLAANDYGAPPTRKRVFFFGFLPDAMEQLAADSFKPPPGVETILEKDALRVLPTQIDPSLQRQKQGWKVVHAHGNGYFASRLHGCIPSGVGDPIALERLRDESQATGFLGTVHSPGVAERYAKTECGKSDPISRSYRLDPDGFCPTLRAGTGRDKGSFQAVRPLHPTEARVITPREAARLQGFPDWFQFAPTIWHSFRQIGSSVSPIIAERILKVVREKLG